MTAIEHIKNELAEAQQWFSRASGMVAANERHTNALTTFTAAAHACCSAGRAGLAKLIGGLEDEGVGGLAGPADAPPIADEVCAYVKAMAAADVQLTATPSTGGRAPECSIWRPGPDSARTILGVGSGGGAVETAVLYAFVDLVANYALQDGKLVKREEEGDDDGE